METKRVQQLAVMSLAHRIASDELKFDSLRSRLGEFTLRYNLDQKDVEQFMEKFLDLLHAMYVDGNQWDGNLKNEKFLEIGLLLSLHVNATTGIKFNGLRRRCGQFCQVFKVSREECSEFVKETLHLLFRHYVQTPSRTKTD